MLRQHTSDTRQKDKEFKAAYVRHRSEKGACLSLTSIPLTFAHIDGLKMSTDKSTLFSKLKVGIIINAPRNIDAFIVDGMFLCSVVLICLQRLVVKQM